MDSSPLIMLRGAAFGYPTRKVLSSVDLDVAPRDFIGLIGDNGSGKSTLLKGLAGLLRPLEGRFDRAAGLRIGYVPQRGRLDPIYPLNVSNIIGMGLTADRAWHRFWDRRDAARILGAAEGVGLSTHLNQPFHELSGGQQQRALIARALVSEPALLLLDEPTSGVDSSTQDEILGTLSVLNRDRGVAVVLIMHDLDALSRHASRILTAVDGGIREAGHV